MNTVDLKEKMVLVGVTALVFLPLRLLAGQYLTEHWLGNLGIATAISVALILLVKKEKLGRFGNIFKNQITKVLWGKSARIIICLLAVFAVYFGTTILLVDRGNTIYQDDKTILFQGIADRNFDSRTLAGPQTHDAIPVQIQYLDYLFSISYAMLNDVTDGWLVNLHLILFMEQVEMLGLFWFYRKVFRPIPSIPA